MSEIKYAYPLILNKVASPQYATPVLRRERLLQWLNDASGCRAAVIAADAGYGKTTLLWQWEREVGFPCYWYKLDRNDRDWTVHIAYLVESIARRHRGFGRRAHAMLQQIGGPGSSRPGVAAYLLAEMHERLTEPCTFIIDDWQYVNAVTEVRGLWNQILRDAPPTCRFLFASRVKPRLQFARFKTHGGYAELQTDALRFTESEIAELFRDVYNDPLDPNDVTELERRTEGWAASLQLVEVSLRERITPEERTQFIRSITATRDSDLFDFLAEEVLDQQPDETRNFLLTTSILQQITPEVAERLAGVHDGRRELHDLEHRGLFTNRLDEERYRYHNLFREFLERRLLAERTEAEVTGLHIHAASYFETTEQWPEAIHHYLKAGLHRQAARLIAKYGEDVVASGGLGLVDEWLHELPDDSIRSNARLSLLYGEACGIRGEWDEAIEALERARTYFSRKGDRRLESLACLKLSTVYLHFGDFEQAAAIADAGAVLAPRDAAATRLRLEGNLAVTRAWVTGSLEDVLLECERIGNEAQSLGLDHFAAIANHNRGSALARMGRLAEGIPLLERAASYWAEPPTSPFADNSDLVVALLAANQPARARVVATDALRRTGPWPRPFAHARFGHAAVREFDGLLFDAIGELGDLRAAGSITGGLRVHIDAKLVELLYLTMRPRAEILAAATSLDSPPFDPRFATDLAPARAIVRHLADDCRGQCLQTLSEIEVDHRRGASMAVAIARVKIGALAFQHAVRRDKAAAWNSVAAAGEMGLFPYLRGWLRRYTTPPALRAAASSEAHTNIVARLAIVDAEGWRDALVDFAKMLAPSARPAILEAIHHTANRETVRRLGDLDGPDVIALRRRLRDSQAARLFVRTFGKLSVHRGSWNGPEIHIDKRRARSLLAVLSAHSLEPLSRDALIDLLWPEADGDSAINSLNQTVFQVRRYLDGEYQAGESPDYVVSSPEKVSLNRELVQTDLDEIARIGMRMPHLNVSQARKAVEKAIDLIRGELLGDLRYEDWVGRAQLTVHNDIRRVLLPIAESDTGDFDPQLRIEVATLLLKLDPYDEAAVLALASAMAASGRRVAARTVIATFVERMRLEFGDDPSQRFAAGASAIAVSSKSD